MANNDKKLINAASLEAAEILEDVLTIERLLSTTIFHPKNIPNPLFRSAFLDLMVNLNDLLSKAVNITNDAGEDLRVRHTNDVAIDPKRKVFDVTDLVSKMRNGMCHMPSKHQYIAEEFSFRFGALSPGWEFTFTGEITHKNETNDDLMFYVGPFYIYFRRQIIPAFQAVRESLGPMTSLRKLG